MLIELSGCFLRVFLDFLVNQNNIADIFLIITYTPRVVIKNTNDNNENLEEKLDNELSLLCFRADLRGPNLGGFFIQSTQFLYCF